jgi:multisubunit Na+/H+ antiporter MnhB subunit
VTWLPGLFDLLLVLLLIGLAWLLLASADLFRAIVLFIAFGLLLSLAWLRLGAADLALAEAVIGAGITGTLLLVGLGRLGSAETCSPARRPTTPLQRLTAPLLIRVTLPSIAVIILLEAQQLVVPAAGLGERVEQQLAASGAAHPVTAVLLNIRGYDTLLEMAVLLLALVTIWSLDRARPLFRHEPVSPVLQGTRRLLLPVLVIFSGALLWQGNVAPGGAFQAGALLAAGLLLAALSGDRLAPRWQGGALRLLLGAGFLVFVLVAAATLALYGAPLAYPVPGAGTLIILIEITATASIAALLAAAVAGGHPVGPLADQDLTAPEPGERPR